MSRLRGKSDKDALILVLAAAANADSLEVNDATFGDLPAEVGAALKEAANEGIPLDEFRVRTMRFRSPDHGHPVSIYVASFDDIEGDFWARYILMEDEVIGSYEN